MSSTWLEPKSNSAELAMSDKNNVQMIVALAGDVYVIENRIEDTTRVL
jgi:hypothetical protein